MESAHEEIERERRNRDYYDFQSSAEMPSWIFVADEQQKYVGQQLSVFLDPINK